MKREINSPFPNHQYYVHENCSKGSYVIGSGEKMELTADIVNSGEDAFNAVLFLQIPRGINYISANTSNSQVRLFVCTSSGAL